MQLTIAIPVQVWEIYSPLIEAGATCYLVGGGVVDGILQKQIKDWDIEIHGLGLDKIVELVSKIIPVDVTGSKFGVVRAPLKGVDIELSVPRRENKCGTGHTDFDITLCEDMPLEEAAKRRDFTINSMMVDLATMKLYDPYCGMLDLGSGILRATNAKTFVEDPLRVFRAMQLVSRKMQCVASETIELCSTMVEECEKLSGDSILGEFSKMLMKAENISYGLKFLHQSGVIKMFPELEALIRCPQNPIHHPEGDVWNHTLAVVEEAACVRKLVPEEWQLGFMFGMLLHDVGKPSVTDPISLTAYGHDIAGVEIAERFMRRLTNNEELIAQVKVIVECHMRPLQMAGSDAGAAAWRRLHNKCPINILAFVCDCDSKGCMCSDIDFFGLIMEQFEMVAGGNMGSINQVLMGRHLIAAGYKPGPNFSVMLKKAYEHQIETGCTDEIELLKVAVS